MSSAGSTQARAGSFSGARLVVLLLGSIAVVAGIILIAFALFEPVKAPCATGEMADNDFVDGRYVPRNEEFATVEEGEAFICHEVPELQAESWTLMRVSAERTVPISQLVRGNGIGVVSLEYTSDGRSLVLDAAPYFGASYFERDLPPEAAVEVVDINGREGRAYRFGFNPDFVTVIWRSGTLEHRATIQTGPTFSLDDLVDVLATAD